MNRNRKKLAGKQTDVETRQKHLELAKSGIDTRLRRKAVLEGISRQINDELRNGLIPRSRLIEILSRADALYAESLLKDLLSTNPNIRHKARVEFKEIVWDYALKIAVIDDVRQRLDRLDRRMLEKMMSVRSPEEIREIINVEVEE
jgi:hypothetical protein